MDIAQKFQQAADLLLSTTNDDFEKLKGLYSLMEAYVPFQTTLIPLNDFPDWATPNAPKHEIPNMPAGFFTGYEDSSSTVILFTENGVYIAVPKLETEKELQAFVASISRVSDIDMPALIKARAEMLQAQVEASQETLQ